MAIQHEKPLQGFFGTFTVLKAALLLIVSLTLAIWILKFMIRSVRGGTVEQFTLALLRHLGDGLWQLLRF